MAGIFDAAPSMKGLLDFAASPMGQGLLATTFGAMSARGNTLQALGRGGLVGLEAYGNARQQEGQMAANAKRQMVYEAQAQGAQAEADERAFDLAQKRNRQSMWDHITPTTMPLPGGAEGSHPPPMGVLGPSPLPPPGLPALPGPGGPAGAGKAPILDPVQLLRNGYSVGEAQDIMRLPHWGKPKVSQYTEVRGPNGLEMVGLDEHGNRVNTGVQPWKPPTWRDTGGAEVAYDPVTLEPVRSVRKTLTPGQAVEADIARRRIALEESQPRGQVVQTDQGVMLVDPRTGRAVPALAPDGTPLTPKLREIPGPARTAILSNAQNLSKIQQALDLLEGKEVGNLKGDKEATGWKGYVPNNLLNRADPDGVDTRAMIADIGSLVIHDRSGAAVTAAETPRLLPFIPLPTDDPATAKKKLTRFKQLYEAEQQAFLETYSREQGYRPPPRPNGTPTGNEGNNGGRPPLSAFERNK